MNIKTITTSALHQAYEVSGPKQGEALMLLHGWPDSPRTWDKVIPHLHDAGYKVIAPYLRGYGPSRFRNRLLTKGPSRTGQAVAYGQDMIDLADRLGLERFHFIGHDWGARAGYALAALFPHRVKSLVAISVPFEPGKAKPPAYPQARAFWYQWLLCSKPGEELFRGDPVAYGRAQWDAWSPAGWYDEQDFQKAQTAGAARTSRMSFFMPIAPAGGMQHRTPRMPNCRIVWKRPRCCTSQPCCCMAWRMPVSYLRPRRARRVTSIRTIAEFCWRESVTSPLVKSRLRQPVSSWNTSVITRADRAARFLHQY